MQSYYPRDSAHPETELHNVQLLQFTDVDQANSRLKALIQKSAPFRIAEARIVVRTVSLNSISGLLLSEDGTEYFFKTHVEPNSILREYYNVDLLEAAGYPIMRPVYACHEPGQQIVVYPFHGSPTMFDVVRRTEKELLVAGDVLLTQEQSDRKLASIYERTYRPSSAYHHDASPIHQLFHARLAGARFREFYSNSCLRLNDTEISFSELAQLTWCINGLEYRQNLATLIELASTALLPESDWGPTVIGHGDAHNGNLFYETSPAGLTYFDPAFAGRHSPLLDLAKPIFHNVFANWMYFTHEVDDGLQMSCRLKPGRIEVTHDYQLSPLRVETLRLKMTHVLRPLLRGIFWSGLRHLDWLHLLKSSLLCCPLLTVNLANSSRFPPKVSLLGLSQCLEVGGDVRSGASFLDSLLDSAAN